VAVRISGNRAAVEGPIKTAKALKEVWDDKHAIERQVRTAKKAIVFCDGIINLAERASSERLACKQLVAELEEARCLLDRRKHPWICKSTPGTALTPKFPNRQDDDAQGTDTAV